MPRRATIPVLLWGLAAACAGCGGGSHEANALMLIEPSTALGKLATAATGTGKQLVALGAISEHRRIMGLGVEIDVWVIKGRRPKKARGRARSRGTVVLLHPLMNGKYWFFNLGKLLARRGWDVVLPDLRAHGRSGGKYITWGAKEKHDIEMVMDELILDGVVSDRIYVLGASLGGAVAIQYAALDVRCRGVVAVSPPASLKRIGRHILPLESAGDYEESLWRAGALAGFDPYRASAVEAAKELACPLILAHGVLDIIVPYTHSVQIYKAARGPKKLIPLALQGHDAGAGQELWLAGRIEQLTKMTPGGRPAAEDLPDDTELPRLKDLEDVDEEKLREELRKLEAIERMHP
jgi:pimeloyl-ACP methyl ester carboxylesterase